MKANGWNLPISHFMTPGKLTVSLGTGKAEADWEEAELHYQDLETSQDWQSAASLLATVLQRKRLKRRPIEPRERPAVPREWPII